MAKFELHYSHEASYESKVEIDIRLNKRPTKEEYQDMLDAIETLNTVAQKYVLIKQTNDKESK